MIAKAIPTPRPAHVPGTPSMVGNKVPLPHRFHLTGGRTVVGNLYKAPTVRLADHLSTLKGFISLTAARCEASGRQFEYILVNQDHVLFVEELPAAEVPAKPTTPGGSAHVSR